MAKVAQNMGQVGCFFGNMLMEIAVIQDRFIPLSELDEVYMDRGVYFADGVYEVIRSYDGRLFGLDEHIDRFRRSLGEVGINNVDTDLVRKRIEEAFNRASIADARVYLHITRGSEPRKHVGNANLQPNFFLTVTEIEDISGIKADGIAVCSQPDMRWKRCDIKSLNLLPNVLAQMEANKKGCEEAILVDEADMITEGTSSSFFMVDRASKELVTRPLGCEILASITRRVVIEIAGAAGLAVAERAIGLDEAKGADELFIGVTTKDIVPVVEFDGERIGDGRPGEYTKKLMEEFLRYVRQAK